MKCVVLIAALAAGCGSQGFRDEGEPVSATHRLSVASEQKILCPGGDGYDSFGQSLDIDEGTLIVGAPQQDMQGAAYAFVRDSSKVWRLQQKILPLTPRQDAAFGGAVTIEGDTAVVTAPPIYSSLSGDAYVFSRSGSTWTQQQRLSPAGGFGTAVDLEGDTLVFGAGWQTVNAVNFAGAAYVYARENGTWVQKQKVTAPTPLAFEFFGNSIAVSGDWMVVGAPGNKPIAGDYTVIGAAYFFHRTAGVWSFEKRASNELYDGFGVSVAVEGDTAAVGISQSYLDDGWAGAVRLYSLAVGNVLRGATLKPSDGKAYDHFGASLAMLGNRMFIGAPGWDTMSVYPGAGYVFERSGGTWFEKLRVVPNHTSTIWSLEAGHAAALAAEAVVLSSIVDRQAGVSSGAVIAFALNPDEPDAGDAGLDVAVDGAADAGGDAIGPDADANLVVADAGASDVDLSDAPSADAGDAVNATAPVDATIDDTTTVDAVARDAPDADAPGLDVTTADAPVDVGADTADSPAPVPDATNTDDATDSPAHDAAAIPAPDAGSSADAASGPPGEEGGCACATVGPKPASRSVALLLSLLSLAARRRIRRPLRPASVRNR